MFTISNDGLPDKCIDKLNLKDSSGIVTSVNNIVPDNNGNVAIDIVDDRYLPLTGKKIMTGQIYSSGGPDYPALSYNDSQQRRGGQIWLFPNDDPSYLGGVLLRARTKDDQIFDFQISNNGTCTFMNKSVICLHDEVSGCYRLSSGLQLCWGMFNANSSVTFAKPFSLVPIITTSIGPSIDLTCNHTTNIQSLSTTGFTTYGVRENKGATVVSEHLTYYIAIGHW